jgi:hypothetical protein
LVVILLLLAVWGGVGAWWFLSRPETHSTDSIGSFRQQLRVLERTGPTTVAPAYRMHTGDLGVYGASHLPRRPVAGGTSRRRQVRKRRRDVFYGLVASIAGAVVLGFLPGLSVMWWLAALLVMVLALYVVVLAQLQAVTTERAHKVRYLQARQSWGGYGEPEPAYLLRRSAN